MGFIYVFKYCDKTGSWGFVIEHEEKEYRLQKLLYEDWEED